MSCPVIKSWPDLYIGSDYGPHDFTFTDANGSGLNLSGWSAYCQIRSSAGGSLILNLAPSGVDNATEGVFRIDIPYTDTSGLTAGRGKAIDFVLKDPANNVYVPVFTGTIDIFQGVSVVS